MGLRSLVVVLVAASLAGTACGREEPASAPPIQLVTGPSGTSTGQAAPGAYPALDAAGVIASPPRNEPFAFRQELEAKYRDGRGIAPTCWDALSRFWDGTSTFFNAPSTMDIWMNGTGAVGRYVGRHDVGYIGGTYTGGPTIAMNVNFGDGGIQISAAFDGPDRIRGTFRVTYISGIFPFEMTRRP